MSSNKFGDKLEELDLSHEEIDRLTKCMKDEKFRDLLKEYAEEISDPENRKKYEEEIAMLERDRGMDVKFINPKPGHVLKTSIDGSQKCFINICTNENLGQPKSRPSVQGKTRGMQWSIPHSVSQAREDVDKAGTKCTVYDVVFHPDTYYLLQKDVRFKKMIHDTALDAVEKQFNVRLDKVNIKTPKMAFKGFPMSSVIRTPNGNPAQESVGTTEVDMTLPSLIPPHHIKHNGTDQSTLNINNQKKKVESNESNDAKNDGSQPKDGYQKPHYTITHRGHFDIQDYRNASNDVYNTWPKELVINIDMPLLSAANSVNLEIFEKRLHLDSEKPSKYKLDINLPFPVAENKGHAKFDKSRHRLTVTLEVLPAPHPSKITHSSAPSLVSEVEEGPGGPTSVKASDPTPPTADGSDADKHVNKVGIEEATASRLIEATETTTETMLTDVSSSKSKPTKEKGKGEEKVPTFIEGGRRHYQEGKYWTDGDELEEISDDSSSVDDPLTKNSAFLIDMVVKYDGLIRRCPQYNFHQDEHFVSFIVEVPHIFEQSLWYAVYNNMLQFCCLSECLDDDMVNSVFQLWIEFGKDVSVDPQRSRVDVSGNNAVFCLRKHKSNQEWQTVKAGFDKDNLEVRRFSTTRNVSELYTLVFQHAQGVSTNPIGVCDVIRKDKDLIIIEFKAKNENKEGSQPNNKKSTSPSSLPPANERFDPSEIGGPSDIQCRNSHLPPGACKKVSFGEDVVRNTGHCDVQDDHDDSDDDSSARDPPAQGTIVIKGEGDVKEVIIDHVTKSAVDLTSKSLIYELDDDI